MVSSLLGRIKSMKRSAKGQRRHIDHSPKYENEQNQQREENRHVVHRPQHHKQLSPEVWHESHQFQDPQQPKSPQHRQSGVPAPTVAAHEWLAQLNATTMKREEKGKKRREICVNVFSRSSSRQYHRRSSVAPASFQLHDKMKQNSTL